MISMTKNRTKILLLLISLCLVAISLIILTTPPAQGYELSIYDGYPSYFFIIIVLTFIFSNYLAMKSIYLVKSKKYFLMSVSVIITLEIILFLIPCFRGYSFFERNDSLTHIGMIKDILIYGRIGQSNFYPLFHLIYNNIVLLTGIKFNIRPILLLRSVIPFFLYMVYVCFIGLITRLKSDKDSQSYYASILFALSIPSLIFTPAGTLFYLFPMFMYIYFVSRYRSQIAYSLLLVIVLFFIPFGHPELVVFMITLILFTELLILLLNRHEFKNIEKIPEEFRANPIILSFITFFAWYSSFTIFGKHVQRLERWFLDNIGDSPSGILLDKLSRSQLGLTQLFQLFILSYGNIVIYLGSAILISLKTFMDVVRSNKFRFNYLLYGLLIFASVFLAIFSIFNNVIVSYGRVLKYSLLFSIILVGIYLSDKYEIVTKEKKYFYTVFLVLIISFSITTFSIFPSPLTYTYNQQVPYSEMKGAQWLLNYGNNSTGTLDAFITFGRFVHYNEGYDYSLENDNLFNKQMYLYRFPPDHFNYTNSSRFGTSYDEDKYLLTSQLIKDYYIKLFPNVGRFNMDDFIRLQNDRSVSKIYQNNEFDIYYVSSFSV